MNVSRIIKAALIIMVGSVLSRVLGLGREVVVAGLFGRGGDVDAFTIAANVSTIVYDLLISGMISAALVPVLSERAAPERRAELGRVLSTILTGGALFLLAAVAVLELVAGPLVTFMAADKPELVAQATAMARVVLPGVIFLGLSGILTAALYSLNRYSYPALAMSALNGAIIAAAFLLGPLLHIDSLVIGMVAGAVLMVVIQAPGLRDLPLRPRLDWRDPAVRQILVLYAPVALSVLVTSMALVVDRRLVAPIEGAISAMRYATTLIQFALGMVSAAISLAALPSLSQHWAAGNIAAYKRTLAFGLRLVLVLVLPAAAGLFFLAFPIVRLVFAHGAFTEADVPPTVLALLCYAIGLPFAAIDQILIFGFYSRQNTITPVTIGIVATVAYYAVAFSLVGPFGMAGVVLANGAQLAFHALVTGVLLYRAIGGLPGGAVGATALKTGLAALLMGVTGFGVWLALDTAWHPAGLAQHLITLIVPGVVALAVYGAVLAVLRVRELSVVIEQLRRRLPGRAVSPPDGGPPPLPPIPGGELGADRADP